MESQRPKEQAFMLELQEKGLAPNDADTFKRLLAQYIDKIGVPPKMSGWDMTATASYTLSNCSDNPGGTECTCSKDD